MELRSTGTTLIGLKTSSFVIVASDQQATMGNTGTLDCKKVFYISKEAVYAGAGTAGHCTLFYSKLKGLLCKIKIS